MNKKRLIYINTALMCLVLLTLTLQTVHIYHHQQSEHHACTHDHSHDDCQICSFVFSHFLAPPVFFYPFPPKQKPIPFQIASVSIPETEQHFIRPHRGPPVLLVFRS